MFCRVGQAEARVITPKGWYNLTQGAALGSDGAKGQALKGRHNERRALWRPFRVWI